MRRKQLMLWLLVVVLTATVAEAQTTYRFETAGSQLIRSSESSSLFYPSGVAIDPSGSVWVADTVNHVIRTMTPEGTFVIVSGTLGVEGSRDGHRTEATFSYPQGIEFDASGNLYIADSGNGVIRRLRSDGIVETFAGRPGEAGMVDGDRLEATFISPYGLAWDVTGALWVSDISAHVIRRIESNGMVSTVAGASGNPGFHDGPGESARFRAPSGIAIDGQGRLWVADQGNGLIRSVTHDGFTETIAGQLGTSHQDGPADRAGFDHPSDIVIDESGIAFVADSWSHTIRMIADGEVTTIAGLAGHEGYRDGKGAAARFNHPRGLALGADGTLFVVDMMNNAVRAGREDDFSSSRGRAIRR